MVTDEDVGRQILSIFTRHRVAAGGFLRRNYFTSIRDADFQRGLNNAVASNWIKVKPRDRYTYELTPAGLVEGRNAMLSPDRPD